MFTFIQNVRCVCSGEIPRCRHFLSLFPLLISLSESPAVSFGISTTLSARQQSNCLAICSRVKKSSSKLPDKLRGRTSLLLLPLVPRSWFGRVASLTTYQYLVPRLRITGAFLPLPMRLNILRTLCFYVVITDEGNSSPEWHLNPSI